MTLALDPGTVVALVLALAAGGLATGFLAGLLGVGGGAFLVPILYELFTHFGVDESVRMHMVLGTSLAVIVPTALRSFSGHYAKGAVDMPAWKRLAPWVAFGVVLGVLTAKFASTAGLKWIWIAAGTPTASKYPSAVKAGRQIDGANARMFRSSGVKEKEPPGAMGPLITGRNIRSQEIDQ